MRSGQEWEVDRGNAKNYLEKAPAATFQDQKRVLPSKKSACGNVPTPKTRFSIKKKLLRQHSRTKNMFFHIKKAPAAG